MFLSPESDSPVRIEVINLSSDGGYEFTLGKFAEVTGFLYSTIQKAKWRETNEEGDSA